MNITDNAELKLIEKYREMVEKTRCRDGEMLGRSFTIPSAFDSDEQMMVSLTLNYRSIVPKMTEMEVKVERGHQAEAERPAG